MFQIMKNAWSIKDIRKKMLYTLLLMLIYRLGVFIPAPGVNTGYIAQQTQNYGVLGFMNLMTGGAFSDYTIFAMGILPYINASIIMQLLTVAIPSLERLAKEDDGPQKIENITRILGVVLAFVQAVGILLGMGKEAVLSTHWTNYLSIGLVITAGSAFLMWLGERITDLGISNGISMLIFTSIVSRVFPESVTLFNSFNDGIMSWWIAPVILLLVLAVVVGVTYVEIGTRRIPVQYAKRVVGRKMYGGQNTHIPMKVNSSGVMPLIFAITILQLPGLIAQFWPSSGFAVWYNSQLKGGAVYYLLYTLLIIAFAYFYNTIAFNPIEISKNMQQYGGFIPGIRPGKTTSDYLMRISSRLTMFGAFYLALIAIVPTIILGTFGLRSVFGPTSILIMISVALEVTRALESQMIMRNYKGFLK